MEIERIQTSENSSGGDSNHDPAAGCCNPGKLSSQTFIVTDVFKDGVAIDDIEAAIRKGQVRCRCSRERSVDLASNRTLIEARFAFGQFGPPLGSMPSPVHFDA